MKITRTDPFDGRTSTRDLPITAEQWAKYAGGAAVQHAFPDLDRMDREFIHTGIIEPLPWTDPETGDYCGPEDDDPPIPDEFDDNNPMNAHYGSLLEVEGDAFFDHFPFDA